MKNQIQKYKCENSKLIIFVKHSNINVEDLKKEIRLLKCFTTLSPFTKQTNDIIQLEIFDSKIIDKYILKIVVRILNLPKNMTVCNVDISKTLLAILFEEKEF